MIDPTSLPPSPPEPLEPNPSRLPLRLYVTIAIAALVTGLMSNIMFGDAPGIGLNAGLTIATFFAGWYLVARSVKIPFWRKACAGLAIAYGTAVAFRASDILFSVNCLLALCFASLACTPARSGLMKKVWDTCEDLLQVAVNVLIGGFVFLFEVPWRRLRMNTSHSAVTIRVLTGVLISVPFLVVFGVLFGSAEVRFGQIFDGLFSWLLPMITNHLCLTLFSAGISLGLLRCAFMIPDKNNESGAPRPVIGLIEAVTALSLLNALFLMFVVTQLPYLFGGQDRVSATPGLQWSQYARSGFFELAWVTGLLIMTLMGFMNLTRTETPKQKNLLCGLCFGLTLLGGIVVASALQRMLLYTSNYGLTELRVYVSTFIVMLACVLLLLNVFNYTGRGRLFLPAALATGVIFSLGIQVVNIQGFIARDVIRRYQGGKGGDLEYLTALSSDAVPEIVRSSLSRNAKSDAVSKILRRSIPENQGFTWFYYPVSVKTARTAIGSLVVQEKDR